MKKENNTQKNQSEHLSKLIQFTPPNQLRRSVQRTLFAYVLEQDDKGLDSEFKMVVEDHFFLIDFLDKLECDNSSKLA